jgi:hypothetical protein
VARDLGVGAEPIPELGPLLGRLGDPAPRGSVGGEVAALLDPVRYDLVTDLFRRAAVARRAWAAGQVVEAQAAIGPQAWEEVFRAAAAAAANRCLTAIEARFATAAERHAFAVRCESAGIPVEDLPPLDLTDQPSEWFRRAGMALDHSWDRLEGVVREELAAWQPERAAVTACHRPRALLWTVTAVVLAAAAALGLSLGGYLPAPGLLTALRNWWWETVPAWP